MYNSIMSGHSLDEGLLRNGAAKRVNRYVSSLMRGKIGAQERVEPSNQGKNREHVVIPSSGGIRVLCTKKRCNGVTQSRGSESR